MKKQGNELRHRVISYVFTIAIVIDKVTYGICAIETRSARTTTRSFNNEELMLPRYAHCVLSRLRYNGHSLLLSSYLSKIGRINNPSCSACGLSFHVPSHLILLCPATDSFRRSLFDNFLSLYDLWSRPWRVGWVLGLHGRLPWPYHSKGVR